MSENESNEFTESEINFAKGTLFLFLAKLLKVKRKYKRPNACQSQDSSKAGTGFTIDTSDCESHDYLCVTAQYE